MNIVMFIIFLLTDLSMIGIFAFVYSGKEQYSDGMVLGVHIPKTKINHEEVQSLGNKYKKSLKKFNLWNLVLGTVVCFLCFWNITLFLIIWMIWLVVYLVVGIGLTYISHRKMYDIKIKHNWMMEGNTHIDTEILSKDSDTLIVDDDEYWKNGWYNNPNDTHLWVQDRMCNTNYSMNMAKPVAKVIAVVTAVFLTVTIVGAFSLILRLENAKITFLMDGNQVMIDAAMYDTHFKVSEIQSVKILGKMPEDDFTRTNGGATEKYLIGHFKGKETGKCMMYLYRGYVPILEIKLTEETIYINSKKKEEVQEWYQKLIE